MIVDVFTLFPEHFDWFTRQRHVSNALEAGNELNTIDYRDTTPLKGGRVDDTPYGGGAGMVMRVDVVDAALQGAYGDDRSGVRKIALTPGGRMFGESLAAELAREEHLALLCGRYEGFDERVVEHLADEAVSIGPYVLSGGELPAMVVVDAVVRQIPGALGAADASVEESFAQGLLEYPQYTRPAEFRGLAVPEVLLSGNHREIARWRRRESLLRTARTRPDLLAQAELTEEERRWLLTLPQE